MEINYHGDCQTDQYLGTVENIIEHRPGCESIG